MIISEILEGYKLVWGRSNKKGVVRRYRCTDGPKKGRVVAKPSTCTTTTSLKKSGQLKKTRRSQGSRQATVRKNTLSRPTATRVRNLNRRYSSKGRASRTRRKFKR
jgi:hypothetical protein